jgi:methylase of polypeptide subunit release factors
VALETWHALREVLAQASYDEQSVRELVRVDGIDPVRGLAVLRLRPSSEGTLGRLVRLFLAVDVLDVADAAAAVVPLGLEELESVGLVERTSGGVRALVRLDPVEGAIVASDPEMSGRRFARDHVILPGPASRTLAALTVRADVSRALDLCCGSGVQALLAARHAGHAVGTDLNPRALRLAELSASLSGIENVEWRLGNLFEPVQEEQFDLIVSNPPFVISPANDLAFRDGGGQGDELSRDVVRGVAGRLSEGGFGHVLCSWAQRGAEHAPDAPLEWLEGAKCDVLVLKLSDESPATHAIRWTSLTAASVAEAAAQAEAWVEYYEELGIATIVTGVVVLRRRGRGLNWTAAEELGAIRSGAGEHVARIFAGHDALAGLAEDRALLDLPLSIPSDVRVVERWSADGTLERARLTSETGMQLPARIVPPGAVAAVRALDDGRTLADAGARSGASSRELQAALPSIRDLVRRGYLEAKDR